MREDGGRSIGRGPMYLPNIRIKGSKKTDRSRCVRKNAKHRAKNRRRRNGLKK